MLKSFFALTILFLLWSGMVANAACTPEEVQAKAQEFMNTAIALAQKDAQRYQAVAHAIQNDLPELRKAADLEKICAFYDDWVAKMQ